MQEQRLSLTVVDAPKQASKLDQKSKDDSFEENSVERIEVLNRVNSILNYKPKIHTNTEIISSQVRRANNNTEIKKSPSKKNLTSKLNNDLPNSMSVTSEIDKVTESRGRLPKSLR